MKNKQKILNLIAEIKAWNCMDLRLFLVGGDTQLSQTYLKARAKKIDELQKLVEEE